MLSLSTRREGSVEVLAIAGAIDIYTATQLRLACLGLEGRQRSCIDMTHVSFMDTIGLGVLLAFQRRAQRRGQLVALVNPPGHVFDSLKALGLEEAFAIHPSCAAAASAL